MAPYPWSPSEDLKGHLAELTGFKELSLTWAGWGAYSVAMVWAATPDPPGIACASKRSAHELAGRGPHRGRWAPVEWGPASVRRAAVSHEIRWSLSGRKWLGPAQCFADTARHSARRKVRIAGRSSPRVVE